MTTNLDSRKLGTSHFGEFLLALSAEPDPKMIQINKQANNAKYLPVSHIEAKLDEFFSGLWQVKNFRWQIVANEVIGSLDLEVFHPVFQQWLTRTGAASVMIQLKSGSKPTEFENKIMNTLEKDFPHLKAECLKNAVKSLGRIFGRDLNRTVTDEPFPPEVETTVRAQIEACTTLPELSTLYNQTPARARESLKAVFSEQRKRIETPELVPSFLLVSLPEKNGKDTGKSELKDSCRVSKPGESVESIGAEQPGETAKPKNEKKKP